MATLPRNDGKRLYHYTNRDAALGSILPTGKFLFSRFDEMRDPYEYREWTMSGAVNGREGEEEAENRRFFEFLAFANDVKRQARLAAFSSDGQDEQTFDSHGWARASMWEHYGESHRGVCLVFDQEKLIASTRESMRSAGLPDPYFKPVEYELGYRFSPVITIGKNEVEMDIHQFKQHVFRFVQDRHADLFYRKATDWSNEMEYRFVVTVPDEFNATVEIDISDALVEIVAGDRFPDWAIPGTLEIADELNVLAKKVSWLGPDIFLTTLKSSNGRAG